MRYTPEIISSLEENQIFVFGSNRRGVHGAGAAFLAKKVFGAKAGVGLGLTGQCYALPTKGFEIETLSLSEIGVSFQRFIKCVIDNPQLDFLLTKVGCGLAGYTTDDIAREFWHGMEHNGQKKIPANLWVPREFVFTGDYEESLFVTAPTHVEESADE